MALIDENAFGMLVLLFDIADLEYGLEPEEFVRTFTRFRDLVLDTADESPLGDGAVVLELGHAIYFEVGDGDHAAEPVSWLKGLCLPLIREGFEISAILTHGGRWFDPESAGLPESESTEGGYRCLRVTRPSEPFQRALHASTHCHTSEGDGWGVGLYVDSEAIEALGKVLKNAPTALEAAGATFYRLGLPRPE